MTDSDKVTPVDANGLERTLSERTALYDLDGDGKLSPNEERFGNALERTLSKRSALYDADGDGKLSPVEEICKKYDT